jgi:hypothetical protein
MLIITYFKWPQCKVVDYEFKNYCVLNTGEICDALRQGKVHHPDTSYCDCFNLQYISINLVATYMRSFGSIVLSFKCSILYSEASKK